MGTDNSIQGLCWYYSLRTRGTKAGTNGTWVMPTGSAPQPDCALFVRPEFGGRSSLRDGITLGVPEFVCEICYSSRSYDLGPKLSLYQSAGVNEYLAVLIEERRFEWRALVNGGYILLEPETGVYRSRIFPGLWIDETAFWHNDSTILLQTLDQGLASQEHQDFAKSLQKLA